MIIDSNNFTLNPIRGDNPQTVVGRSLGRDGYQNDRGKRSSELGFLAWLIVESFEPYPISRVEIEGFKSFKVSFYVCVGFHPTLAHMLFIAPVMRSFMVKTP